MADKPKRPLSAYMLFLQSARESIKRENPGITVTEVAKRAGELWRAMKDKSVWVAKAAKAKNAYDRAMRQFQANAGSNAAKARGAKKRRAKPAKKPLKKGKRAQPQDESD
ncbi:high mobility group protein D-like [Scaptodrosophila lebanonensis]|uniref:High mobility group protein D-like n=1 Tax=Drosophila lebanonensis TaxID=7225 RepID=A0A6J2U4U6_DROLE|nr:high mobility group protein D-like [Scaptodrosophila lebanonensis]